MVRGFVTVQGFTIASSDTVTHRMSTRSSHRFTICNQSNGTSTDEYKEEAPMDDLSTTTPKTNGRRSSTRKHYDDVDGETNTPSNKRQVRLRKSKSSTSHNPTMALSMETQEETNFVSTAAIPVTPDGRDTKKAATTKTTKTEVVKQKNKTSSSSYSSSTTISPPQGWQDIYTLVEELRQDRTAPCDGQGAEALAEPNLSPKDFRFQTLIALILSSQTKDAVVGQAMRNLQQYGLTIENLHPSKTPAETLNGLIRGVGFHNNKTKYIHQVVQILMEKYNGDIPPTAEEMIKELPGVGPKMAYIVENICWDTQSGIGVDTHMHRLFPLLGYVSKSVKNPEQTRHQLEAWLPKEYWKGVNLLWVGFGQEVQQEKSKVLRKALNCSRPYDALMLLQRVGMDVLKEGAKCGWSGEIDKILSSNNQSR